MNTGKVFVVGAGFMGNGIAQTAALAGNDVTMSDIDSDRLEAGGREIESSLARLRSKGRITDEQSEDALGGLASTTRLEDARDADLVIEAVPENLRLKKEIFEALDSLCGPRAILATNTSAIPITSIAAATRRPDRVVGIHFFGPVPVMKLCEVIGGMLTSAETLEQADEWARFLGKETVIVRRDRAGFVANRVHIPGSLEAVRLVGDGVASPEEIDRAATFGAEGGVGPLRIMDAAGIDVTCNTAMGIYEDTGEERFFPPPLMRRMVAANLLGRKTGRGFYDYSTGERIGYELVSGMADRGTEGAARSGFIMERILFPIILEAVRLVETGVSTPEEIDKASRLGFGFPIGPLALADGIGLDKVLKSSSGIHEETGNRNYLPPSLLRRMVKAGSIGGRSGGGFYSDKRTTV